MSASEYVEGFGEVSFPPDIVSACTQPGRVDAFVADCLKSPSVRGVLDAVPFSVMLHYLDGIWQRGEMEAAGRECVEGRFLWVVCGNIRDNASGERGAIVGIPADDAQTDDAQTDDAQTDDAQTDDAQTDDAQTDAAQTDAAQTDAVPDCGGVRRVRAVIVVTFRSDSFELEERVIEALDGTTAHIHMELSDMGVDPSVYLDDVFGGHTSPGVFSPSENL